MVVPLEGDDPDRAANWRWLQARYARQHPGWVVARCAARERQGVSFVKGRAANATAAAFAADVLVVADADCIAGKDALERAVAVVAEQRGWAVPFGDVYRLNPEASAGVRAGPFDVVPSIVPFAQLDPERPFAYRGKPGGGIVVAAREAWDTVGGFDERFVGYGGEDFALGHALSTCAGRPHRESAPLWHLWHPGQPGYDPSGRLPIEARRLLARYRAATRSTATMRALLDERGGNPMGCGCKGTTPEQASAPRIEARCLTCGLTFTAFDGEDGAEVHKAKSEHIIEGYRGLRAKSRRGRVVLDPFAPAEAISRMAVRDEELNPAAMSAPTQR